MGEQIEKLAQFIARTGWDDMPGVELDAAPMPAWQEQPARP